MAYELFCTTAFLDFIVKVYTNSFTNFNFEKLFFVFSCTVQSLRRFYVLMQFQLIDIITFPKELKGFFAQASV